MIFCSLCRSVIFTVKLKDFYTFTFSYTFLSVGWDVKWCPVWRITTLLARQKRFHWISKKSRLESAARETSSKYWSTCSFFNSIPLWKRYLCFMLTMFVFLLICYDEIPENHLFDSEDIVYNSGRNRMIVRWWLTFFLYSVVKNKTGFPASTK